MRLGSTIVALSGTQSIPGDALNYIISHDLVYADPLGAVSLVTDPTKIIVPAAAAFVRFAFSLSFNAPGPAGMTEGTATCRMIRSGTNFNPEIIAQNQIILGDWEAFYCTLNGGTGLFAVTPGDYWQLRVAQDTTQALLASHETIWADWYSAGEGGFNVGGGAGL